MALKKHYSYRDKLFIPIAAIIWIYAIYLGIFHYMRTMEYRKEVLTTNIEFINNRIIDAYNNGNRKKAEDFLKFIDHYYSGTTYEQMSVDVYDVATEKSIASAGAFIPAPENLQEIASSPLSGDSRHQDAPEYIKQAINSDIFFYKTVTTDDGRYIVQTVMPMTSALAGKLNFSHSYFIMVFGLTTAITIFFYIFTSHLGKNIRILKEFVNNAVNDTNFNTDIKFPPDELGDISHKIVTLYQDRLKAIETIKREHKIALKATEEKNKLKRQLTDNINHELKTPIGIIKGYIDTLIDNPDMDNETQLHFLKKSSGQIARLTDMLNSISTITRLEEGNTSIPTEKIDFHDVVFTTANDIVESGINGTMEVVFNIPFDCYIKGNFNLLGNVLNNLAKNAATYSGGTEMGINLIAENKHFYTFSFYDNGKGLEPTHLPHIFERFYRVDSGRSRKNGGTGLGLPIVKSTIITLGGTISVRNRKGGGLEFLFTLPKWND